MVCLLYLANSIIGPVKAGICLLYRSCLPTTSCLPMLSWQPKFISYKLYSLLWTFSSPVSQCKRTKTVQISLFRLTCALIPEWVSVLWSHDSVVRISCVLWDLIRLSTFQECNECDWVVVLITDLDQIRYKVGLACAFMNMLCVDWLIVAHREWFLSSCCLFVACVLPVCAENICKSALASVVDTWAAELPNCAIRGNHSSNHPINLVSMNICNTINKLMPDSL